jgi:hypothetical protein
MKRILLAACAALALGGSAFAMDYEAQSKAETIGAIAEGGRLCPADVRAALTLLAARGLRFMESDGFTFERIKPFMDQGPDMFDAQNAPFGIQGACTRLTPLALRIEDEWAARGKPSP